MFWIPALVSVAGLALLARPVTGRAANLGAWLLLGCPPLAALSMESSSALETAPRLLAALALAWALWRLSPRGAGPDETRLLPALAVLPAWVFAAAVLGVAALSDPGPRPALTPSPLAAWAVLGLFALTWTWERAGGKS